MNVKVSITKKEKEAIESALAEFETNCEFADQEYCDGSQPTISALKRLLKKIEKSTLTNK